MNPYIYRITDPEMAEIISSGGKGSNLHKLSRLQGIQVPEGLIVTTRVFQDFVEPVVAPLLAEGKTPKEIRESVRAVSLPPAFSRELENCLKGFGDEQFAVRSSATAEDLPDASFAGQQDSFLNVRGAASIQQAVMNCFASLYNDRAVAYREKNAYRHLDVRMAVVIQKMVPAVAAGVLFTADPLTSDRGTTVLEAVDGLGEELVSGRKTPFIWKVRGGQVQPRGTGRPPLTEQQVRVLVQIAETIASAFRCPQDIEWCWDGTSFSVVQARAITSLFPLPPSHDGFKRLFLSVGHMQMMSDVILPLGMSFSKQVMPFQMVEAGGRLFADITHDAGSAIGRQILLKKMAGDPQLHRSLAQIMGRKDYIRTIPKGPRSFQSPSSLMGGMVQEALRNYRRNDPGAIADYVERQRQDLRLLEARLSELSGVSVVQGIREDRAGLEKTLYDPAGYGMILLTQLLIARIDKAGKMLTGEPSLSSRLSKAVAHNITSEMGLALSRLSDIARKSPEVVSYLESCGQSFSIDTLAHLQGGQPVAEEFRTFLTEYGMRAAGEIDITKPRYREQPWQLLPTLLTNIHTMPEGYATAMFQQGRRECENQIEETLALAEQKMGKRKAAKLGRSISVFRNFLGTREYPKYFMICRYDIYKKALTREAERLVSARVLQSPDDLHYLYLDELEQALMTGMVDQTMIQRRRKAYAAYAPLTPPSLIFSDGEVPAVDAAGDIPSGALAGVGVSAGLVEGRARVVTHLGDAKMEPGDILVTSFTDPGWTPVFVTLSGLVTEVGGMMSHGAVITREYGLPAVVGVNGATRQIPDGARIRVNGDAGYVEILV